MKKWVSQENDKALQNKTKLQEPYKKNKSLDCPPIQIIGTICEVDQKRTLKNAPENKNVLTMHKALHPRDDIDRLYVLRKEGGRWLTSIEDSVDTSIQRFEDYKKSAEEN